MKATLRSKIENAIWQGYEIFFCGMGLGFDMICAETVLKLKKKYPNSRLYGALPCFAQDIRWPSKTRKRYHKLLGQLDGIRCIHDDYTGADCMLERNRYMVDRSSVLIALYQGLSGGTKSTINYAKRQGLEIVIITP